RSARKKLCRRSEIEVDAAGIEELVCGIARSSVGRRVICHLVKDISLTRESPGADLSYIGTQLPKSGKERLRCGSSRSDQRSVGNECDLRSRAADSIPFRVVKEKQFVLDDWPAECKPKLIAGELRFV